MVQSFLEGPLLNKNRDFMPIYQNIHDAEDEKLDNVSYKHSDEQPLLFNGPLYAGAKSRAGKHLMRFRFLTSFSTIKMTYKVVCRLSSHPLH